ncbi:unnamed protein product [Caenorhabditis auriculariae]|uniref:Uncharacterized protein n=1 Tax=Caenorhabditis auriculariae TaxID=2777116 RepID=A0A8S1HH46_9PELO|nr:unnamed protein product [Caenorhabditis auriculariae]
MNLLTGLGFGLALICMTSAGAIPKPGQELRPDNIYDRFAQKLRDLSQQYEERGRKEPSGTFSDFVQKTLDERQLHEQLVELDKAVREFRAENLSLDRPKSPVVFFGDAGRQYKNARRDSGNSEEDDLDLLVKAIAHANRF